MSAQEKLDMRVDRPEMTETRELRLLYGTYADILFVLLPFAVVGMFKLWNVGLEPFLLSYDLSLAAAVLGGLAVVKFLLGMLVDPTMAKHREWITFLVAGTFFLILAPSLLFSVLVMLSEEPPKWVMFIQPLLVVLGITAYSSAVLASNRLRKDVEQRVLDEDVG